MNDLTSSAVEPKHLVWISSDQRALDEWRKHNPGQLLDCRGVDLSGRNLHNRDLSYVDFTGANFRGAQLGTGSLESCKLERAVFDEAKLIGANLTRADLSEASFLAADLSGAKLNDARFHKNRFDGARLPAAIFSEGIDLSNCSFPRAYLNDCVFRRVSFKGCDLSGASLRDANCTESCFDDASLEEASLNHAALNGCSFKRSQLRGASLEAARLDHADLSGASLLESQVDAASFNKVAGLPSSLHLETVKILGQPPKYLETVIIPLVDRLVSWDRLRVVGKLPLFGVSYSALVLMPFLFYLLELFNNRVNQMRSAAASIEPNGASGHLARALVDHLHSEPVPRLSFVLFLCTIVLAIGATIYAALCPARIKEFSKGQWQDQLGRSLILYLPFSWKYRWARIACAACYAVGGAGALFVLLTKIVGALIYLAGAEVG